VISYVRRHVRLLTLVGALSAVALAVAPAASEASPVELAPCNNAPLSQPFAQWGDSSSYELAPGGDFESIPTTWTLSGGASIVSGSEPYAVTGTLGQYSLSLPSGASATSPSTCVDAAYPTMRMFVGGTGTVAVAVDYSGIVIPTGLAVASGNWVPTAPMLTGSAIAGALNGGTAQVSLVLIGLTGSPQVDDVFIDPWGGH
jgi:hypothetical protein